MTVERRGPAPTLADAAAQIGVAVGALDPAFGIVLIDPQRGIYAVRVDADALGPETAQREGVRGPFADPKIGPLAC